MDSRKHQESQLLQIDIPQAKPVSACKILDLLSNQYAKNKKNQTSTPNTVEIEKAACACQQGLVVSPYTKYGHNLFYTSLQHFPAELHKIKNAPPYKTFNP